MHLQKASRKKAKIKMCLQGPSGSGKTYSSLFSVLGSTYGNNGGQVTVSTWAINNNTLTINFSGTLNTNIVAGDSFTWFDGSTSTAGNLIAITASTTQITTSLTSSNRSGSGGWVQLTTITKFNLPNTQARTVRGYNGSTYAIAGAGGVDSYALTPANIASHKHDLTLVQNGIGSSAGGIATAQPPAEEETIE